MGMLKLEAYRSEFEKTILEQCIVRSVGNTDFDTLVDVWRDHKGRKNPYLLAVHLVPTDLWCSMYEHGAHDSHIHWLILSIVTLRGHDCGKIDYRTGNMIEEPK